MKIFKFLNSILIRMLPSEFKKKLNTNQWILLILILGTLLVLAFWVAFLIYPTSYLDKDSNALPPNAIGDSYGMFNAFFAAMGTMFLSATIFIQIYYANKNQENLSKQLEIQNLSNYFKTLDPINDPGEVKLIKELYLRKIEPTMIGQDPGFFMPILKINGRIIRQLGQNNHGVIIESLRNDVYFIDAESPSRLNFFKDITTIGSKLKEGDKIKSGDTIHYCRFLSESQLKMMNGTRDKVVFYCQSEIVSFRWSVEFEIKYDERGIVEWTQPDINLLM